MAPVRFGIIGTNYISEWFVQGCRESDGAGVPAAVYSRKQETGDAFAKQQGIEQVFTDLEAMFQVVDAVYVASPNGFHYEQALAAIAAGKHVLVEKVMGTNQEEVTGIFEAGEKAGVVVMEAMRHLHAPAHQLLRDWMPKLGPLRQVQFNKLQYSGRYDKFRAGEVLNAFNPALGNSSIADIGVYVLQPARDLFGEPLNSVGSSIVLNNGFEGAGSMNWRYSDFIVDLSWSKITKHVTPSFILGEDGALTADDLGEPTLIQYPPRGGETQTLFEAPNSPPQTMHHEVRAFAAQVARGETDPRFKNVSIACRRLMDEHLARVANQS